MSFNLHKEVKDALKQNPSADPHVIADMVAADIPARQLRSVVSLLLPELVRVYVRRERGASVPMSEPGVTKSEKWQGVRDSSTDPKRWRVFALDGWKFLADCTAEDCDFIAEEYEKRAAANQAQAKFYRRLGDTIRRAGAASVAELPDQAVEEVAA